MKVIWICLPNILNLNNNISNIPQKMHPQKQSSLFGTYFNLHPQDAYVHVEQIAKSLGQFTDAFKERIQIEIDYSKSLLKVAKRMQKYINPAEPTPISYISSAFKVEHQQRARHALELAEYLHTEIEVPCQNMYNQMQAEMKKIQRQFKLFYKQGEAVEETYQKNLKKYFKSRQQWQQNMIAKNILNFTPGTTQSQRQKAIIKLQQQKKQNEQYYLKYLQSLQIFNTFAARYNNSINGFFKNLQEIQTNLLSQQTDSLRKLIISEINMFKNIEYDLLNISRQMELVKPQSQIECFVINNKDHFQYPIISIYAQGPVVPNRYEIIDFKFPLSLSMFEETLIKIDKGVFPWLLENKNNSTLRYAVERLLKRYEGEEPGDNDFLEDFQDSINHNKTVKSIPIDSQYKKQSFLNGEEVYSLCLEIITGVAQLLKVQELPEIKIKSIYEKLEMYLNTHHFYRFIAYLALDQYQNIHDQKINTKLAIQNYSVILKSLLQKSIKNNDIFVIRNCLNILFSVTYIQQDTDKYLYLSPAIQQIDLWQRKDFWEAIIFEATYQLITLLPIVQRSELKQVYLMRQKNIIFSGLLTFCHYMITLGCERKDVRYTMGRFCMFYNLYEEHELDLAKTIDKIFSEKRDSKLSE